MAVTMWPMLRRLFGICVAVYGRRWGEVRWGRAGGGRDGGDDCGPCCGDDMVIRRSKVRDPRGGGGGHDDCGPCCGDYMAYARKEDAQH